MIYRSHKIVQHVTRPVTINIRYLDINCAYAVYFIHHARVLSAYTDELRCTQLR